MFIRFCRSFIDEPEQFLFYRFLLLDPVGFAHFWSSGRSLLPNPKIFPLVPRDIPFQRPYLTGIRKSEDQIFSHLRYD